MDLIIKETINTNWTKLICDNILKHSLHHPIILLTKFNPSLKNDILSIALLYLEILNENHLFFLLSTFYSFLAGTKNVSDEIII